MAVINQPAGFLISGQSVSGANAVIADTRAAANYHYIQYVTTSPSAQIEIEASVDKTGWMLVALYTATTTTASAQLAGYYPYLRGVVNSAYGGGGATGSAYLYLAPGMK